jgi:uncharacterized membrane-anchored protein YhcB (DUF1043 family)
MQGILTDWPLAAVVIGVVLCITIFAIVMRITATERKSDTQKRDEMDRRIRALEYKERREPE